MRYGKLVLALLIASLIASALQANPVSAASGNVLQINGTAGESFAWRNESYTLNDNFTLVWNATVRDPSTGFPKVYIMEVNFSNLDKYSITGPLYFYYNGSFYACAGSSCTEFTINNPSDWHEFKIFVNFSEVTVGSFPHQQKYYVIEVEWYVDGSQVRNPTAGQSTQLALLSLQNITARVPTGGGLLYIDDVKEYHDSNLNASEDFDDGTDGYFVVGEINGYSGEVGIVDISQVPLFGSLIMGFVGLVALIWFFGKH